MTKEELDFIGSMNMCDEISNEAYKKIVCHCEDQQPCDDCISRKAIKRKLQEHHDFFIDAYGGFSNMSQNDKSRVDEINNCIAMIVNEPSVTPKEKTGKWKYVQYDGNPNIGNWYCSECNRVVCEAIKSVSPVYAYPVYAYKYCPNCGARMVEPQESEDKE